MSSDFCAFQEPFFHHHRHHHSNPVSMFNSEALLDSFLQEISDDPIVITSEPQSLEELAQTQFTNLENSPDFANGFLDCPVYGVKMEGSPPSVNAYFSGSEGYGGESEMVSFLQRSYSGDGLSCGGGLQGTLFQPPLFGGLTESPNNSFSNGQFEGHLRRVFSTGDLPKKTAQRVCTSLLGSQSSGTFMEEPSFKVGKYSPEEKKERIDRYKAKRGLRNYNKTIKYACRKTLADNRPRIRGRFARNDEPVENLETTKSASGLNGYEYEDDHWVEGINERDAQRGHFSSYFGGSTQFDPAFIGY